MGTQTTSHLALHLLHGWWTASCPDCGHELAKSRDQEAAERAGARRRCPICRPDAQPDGDPGHDQDVQHGSAVVPPAGAQPVTDHAASG